MIDTAIIILHYKNKIDTLECIKSIFNSDDEDNNFIVILINNSSADDLKNSLERISDKIILIQNDINTGFAQGNNIGIRKAIKLDCKNIILLNNDTLIKPDSLKRLVEYADSNKDVGIFSPKIYFASGFEFYNKKYKESDKGKVIWYAGGKIDWKNIYASHIGVDEVDNGQFDKISDTDFATGCCLLIKKEIIDKIGYFDEKYYLYYEDIDLSLRAKKHGYRVVYNPSTSIWHKNASSSGKPGSLLHQYYQTRNRLYFGLKYANLKLKALLIKESLQMLSQGGIRRKSIIDYYTGHMGGSYHEN